MARLKSGSSSELQVEILRALWNPQIIVSKLTGGLLDLHEGETDWDCSHRLFIFDHSGLYIHKSIHAIDAQKIRLEELFLGSITAQVETFCFHYCNFEIMLRVQQVSGLLHSIIPVCHFRIAKVSLDLLIVRQQDPLITFIDLPSVGHPVMSLGASLWQQKSS